MLKVDTVNNKSFNRSNIPYECRLNSFGNNPAAQQAYMRMNKDVYVDYVDGDISLFGFIANKLKNFVHILSNQDPMLEVKAQIIEESLKQQARQRLCFKAIA